MIKVKVNGGKYHGSYEFNSQAEADNWLAKKEHEFGEKEPTIYAKQSDIPANCIAYMPYVVDKIDDQGNRIQEQAKDMEGNQLFAVLMPPEFTIEFQDMSLDPVWKNEEADRLRRLEYPSIEDLVVALWENDKAKIAQLEQIRQNVKKKYPKV